MWNFAAAIMLDTNLAQQRNKVAAVEFAGQSIHTHPDRAGIKQGWHPPSWKNWRK
jgi:hypothetical protein